MTTYTWSNPNGGSFGDASNWVPTGVPGGEDSAYFNLGGDSTYTIDGNGTAGYILVYDNVTFTGTIYADQLTGTFTAFQVGDGGSAIFDSGSLDSAAEARIGDQTGSGALSFVDAATGTLTASSSGNALDVAFADDTGVSTSGTVSVDGSGSSLTLLGGAYIGTDGAGTLTVSDNGLVQLDEYASTYTDLDVGEGSGATGLVTVTSDGTLSVGEYTVIGDAGTGTMDFSDGATGDFHGTYYSGSAYADSYALYLGGNGGSGTLSVDGAGTSVTTDEGILVGQYGDGDLMVTHNATLAINGSLGGTYDNSYIGSSDTGTGTVSVSGSASIVDNGVLIVGEDGNGTIDISLGGTVTSNAQSGDVSGELGAALGGVGTGTISGGLWDAKQSFAVGYQGDGVLTVETNGKLQVDGTFLRVARDAGSSGTLTVDNGQVYAPNALLTVGPDITGTGDGTGGNGLLHVEDNSVVTADSAVIGGLSGGGGSVDVNDASLKLDGDLSTGAGTSTLTIESSGSLTVDGTIALGGGGGGASLKITGSGGLYDQGGGITLGALGTLTLDSTAYLDTASGATTAPLILDGGTLDILGTGALRAPLSIDVTGGSAADPSAINGAAAADVAIAGGITFTGTTSGVLLLGPGFDTGNAINQISAGDTLDVRIASGDVFDTAVYDAASNTLTLSETGQDTTLTLHIVDDGYGANSFMAVADTAGGTDVSLAAVCYVSGTRILTSSGEVPVEELQLGDHIVTRSGITRPITWIGHRLLDASLLAAHPDSGPVRILAGAFGKNLPTRSLYLSPGHPVLVGADADGEGGVLVPIMCLINGTSVARESVKSIIYWHVELAQHDIMLAEGLPAQSFLDYGNRTWFENGAEHALTNPDFIPPGLDARCRPVAVDGPLVEAERRRIDTLFAVTLDQQCNWPTSEMDAMRFLSGH